MKIVIDIPDGCYEELCNARFPIQDAYRLVAWINDGTPLPEHYGDLIDRDRMLDEIEKKNPEWVSETGKRKRYARLVYYWAVKNAKAVIEGSDSK